MTTERVPLAGRGIAAGALCLALGLVVAGPAFGQESPEAGTSESSSAAQPSGPAELELTDQTTWVRQGETFRLQVAVNDAPPASVLQLVVHDRLTSRNAFAATFDGILGPTRATPVSEPFDDLTQAPDGGTELSFPVGDGGVSFDREGVYPVEVLLTDQAGTTLASLDTFLLLLPEEGFPPLSVALIMEIGAAPGLKPDGTVQLTANELAELGSRTETLLSVPDLPLTVAPVPETIDALARVPDPGPQLVDDLEAVFGEREVLARPYVDVDLQAMADAGLMSQATSELEAGVDVLRTRFDGVEATANVWLTGATVGETEAAAWRDRGVERAVVPESAISSIPDLPVGAVPAGSVSLPSDGASEGPVAFVSDQALVDRLLGDQGRLGAHRLLSELTMIWFERPATERGVVIRIPDQERLDPELVEWVLEELRDTDALHPVTVTDLFESVPPADGEQSPMVELEPKEPPDDLRGIAEPLDRGLETWTGLADSFDDPDLIGSLRRSLLIAPGVRTDTGDRRAYITRVNDAARAIAGAVSAPPNFRITLTAREGTIPLTIANTSDQDMAVMVHLDSNQLEFPRGERFDIVVPPEGVRVDLDVRTRTSGAFPLRIMLTTPDGNVILDETTFDIRSTAVPRVGLVLSIGAGLFLLIWWTRNWRHSRRNSHSQAELARRS